MSEENNKPEESNQAKENEAAKNKVDVSKKDPVAYLKELGIKEVSDKTFINATNLEALLEKNFESLSKTKALGFIQILEREFDLDLKELKNEYLLSLGALKEVSQNSSQEPQERIVPPLSQEEIDERPKKLLIYGLLAGALLYGGYYFFKNRSVETNTTIGNDMNVVKNDVVTEEAKENLLALDETYEKEINTTDLNLSDDAVETMADANTQLDANMLKLQKEIDHESNNSVDVEDVTPKESENNESAMQSALQPSPAVEEEISLAQVQELEETTRKKKPVEVAAKNQPEKEEKKSKTSGEKPKKADATEGGLYIAPTQKAWVGVIYLDTMKKKDYLIRKRLHLDATKDQIILVGHKNFKIYNHGKNQHFKSKKMVRFLYRDGKLSELSKKEYLDYLGSTHW